MPRGKSKPSEAKDENVPTPAPVSRRGRAAQRPYPHFAFEEALEFASAIQRMGGSNAVRRLTVFDQLKKAPESSASRQLIVTAGKYGLVKGGVQSETLQLTPDGDMATNPDVSPREQAKARIRSGIESVDAFKALYEKLSGQKLPSSAILEDAAVEIGIPEHLKKECIEVFVANLRFLGLLQTLSGAERILKIDHALDAIPSSSPTIAPSRSSSGENPMTVHSDVRFDRVCFYIGPIGDDGSEFRKHSDLILETLVRPALEQFGFEVRRADEIQNPGLINKQIFEYLLKSRLAIVDLSYHNPNVFYELAIRHARNLPTVQLIRKADRIPFDVNQSRTVIVDTTDLYTFVPKIETYRLEISSHIRSAIDDPSSAENPLSAYFPDILAGSK